jgi:protease IV
MKQFFKMFFASLLAVVVASVIVVGITIGMVVSAIKGAKTQKTTVRSVSESSILVLETDKKLHEQGERNSLASFSDEISYSAGLHDIVRALHEAKTDDKIKAVLLRLEGGNNGWASMAEVREALVDYKRSGKKLYAYGDAISQRDYFLASAADVVYLNPTGMMELKGLASQLTFFKGTLDKLGIQPEIFYAGKFKSATEPFRAEKMSDANRLQLSELQHDIWSGFLTAAAQKANSDTATIHQLASVGGIYFASDALKAKLIDGAKYWDEMEDVMRKVVDKKADEKLPYLSINEYVESLEAEGKGSNRIAILFAEGQIVDGSGEDYEIGSETLVKAIRQIRRNEKIKAVVLRVNSPGGSALASEIILRELQLLKAKKPLIVSMGNVAASGGYYISAAADSIFANPNTITGSIGVFGMMFNLGDALKDKLGVTFDEVKNAPLADFPTMSRPLTVEEAGRMQATIDTIYSTFKNRVAKGRRMDVSLVDTVAQGRVWTGTDAKAIGLVDGLGGLDRALRSAAAKAGLSEYKVLTYPEPVDQFQSMIKRLKSNPLGQASVKQAISRELQDNFVLYQQLQSIRRMAGRAQMMMPFTPEFL